jgi:hypothetical protein
MLARLRAALVLAPLALFACSSSGGAADAGPVDVPGQTTTVTAFDKTPIYFTGSDNKRKVDATVTFPDAGLYESITLHLALECPSGGCDPWDRFGSLGIVADPSNPSSDATIELQRFMTPYHVGASWDLDVTALRPLLSGQKTLRAYIDTWVGPGSSYGGGWLLSASFEMKGGIPARVPVSVTPIFDLGDVVYGDPGKTIPSQLAPKTLPVDAGASQLEVRAFVTGHGQGNAGNCAEFCQKTHTFTAGATANAQKVWRADCATTAAPGQQGTWKYARAGWCPGADVTPWVFDASGDVVAAGSGRTITIGYDVEAYENSCRPGVASCTGCTLGTTCDYDGANHTEPHYSVSALLIGYR